MSAAPYRPALLGAALVLAAGAPLRAQDSIVVQVGGELAGSVGEYITIPITADLRGAPGRLLGGYRITVRWSGASLYFYDVNILAGSGNANTDSAYYPSSKLTVAALAPSGVSGVVPLVNLLFYVSSSTPTAVTLEVHEMTAAAGSSVPFEDLTPITRVVNGSFCQSAGRWGDVDNDGVSNSRDALAALSEVVGLPPGAGMNPALADVDGDGVVTSRDALVILSHAVGLPVTGFRVMLRVAGGCSTGSPVTLVLAPDTVELLPNQRFSPILEGRDSTGRPTLTLGDAVWRSRNASVAGIRNDYYGRVEIEGRAPGATWLVAELGAGLRDSMRVEVVARRTHWVDAAALGSPFQLGSARHPFAYIGDALEPAYQDAPPAEPGIQRLRSFSYGDTVRVRSGVYEEQIYSYYLSATIIGDSLNRPIIDVRGAPGGYSGYPALDFYGPINVVLAHLVLRGGGAQLDVANSEVRRVRFEALGTQQALDITADWAGGNLGQRGSVRIENVEVLGYGGGDGEEGGRDAIEVEDADTVIVRNSLIRGDTTMSSRSCGSFGSAIGIEDAHTVRVTDNVIDGSPCSGIRVSSQGGEFGSRAEIWRNRISRTRYAGIVVSSSTADLRNNVVTTIRNPDIYSLRAGIQVYADEVSPDTLLMRGDSIVDVGGPGLWVDSGLVITIDSLTVTRAGLDSAYYYGTYTSFQAAGVLVASSRARIAITNSRINDVRNPFGGTAHGIVIAGHRPRLTTRGNHISQVRGDGIRLVRDCNFYFCFYGDTLTADSAHLARDTIVGAAGAAVNGFRGGAVRLDSIIARESRDGLMLVRMGAADLRASRFVADTAGVTLDAVAQASLAGVAVDSSLTVGLTVLGATGLVMDSSAVMRSAVAGMGIGGLGRVSVRRTRFENNLLGVRVLANGSDSVFIRQGSFIGNSAGGIANEREGFEVFADSNYWGSALGPSCDSDIGDCAPGAGDSVLTFDVTFTPFLTGAPITGAPGPLASLRPRAARNWTRLERPARLEAAVAPAPVTAARGADTRPRSRVPRSPWQKGRERAEPGAATRAGGPQPR